MARDQDRWPRSSHEEELPSGHGHVTARSVGGVHETVYEQVQHGEDVRELARTSQTWAEARSSLKGGASTILLGASPRTLDQAFEEFTKEVDPSNHVVLKDDPRPALPAGLWDRVAGVLVVGGLALIGLSGLFLLGHVVLQDRNSVARGQAVFFSVTQLVVATAALIGAIQRFAKRRGRRSPTAEREAGTTDAPSRSRHRSMET
jgi:predicted lipid-binding transport protein (Tim44 family)